MICPTCQRPTDGVRFCTLCGAPLPPAASSAAPPPGPPSGPPPSGPPPGWSPPPPPAGPPPAGPPPAGPPPGWSPPPPGSPGSAAPGQTSTGGDYDYLFADGAATASAPAPTGPPAARRGRGPVLGAVAAGVLLLAGAATAAGLLLTGGDDDEESARPEVTRAPSSDTASPSEADPPTAEPSEPTEPSEPSETAGPQPQGQLTARVRRLPGGLSCADLAARDLTFPLAVGYWNLHQRPISMDGDANGIPCETVYPPEAVRALFGSLVDTAVPDVTLLPAGLDCAYFTRFQIDYPYAVAYWRDEPDLAVMDADGNSRPCEDAYPRRAVAEFWR
ncbi:hypothetical protein [Nocardioides ferulae]|uniref:hypothetical protein n=1 Tax=Nocardioides ferulae TaxID=2340821 RepID=UPI000EAC87F1|nr:hypothetical protein [Nocardioides ferulae]